MFLKLFFLQKTMATLYTTTDEGEARELLRLKGRKEFVFSNYDAKAGMLEAENKNLLFNPMSMMVIVGANLDNLKMFDEFARKLAVHRVWSAIQFDGRIYHYGIKQLNTPRVAELKGFDGRYASRK